MDINFQETFNKLKETLNDNQDNIKKHRLIADELERESLKLEGAIEMLINISNALKENEESSKIEETNQTIEKE